jgi:Tfp pilus assembly protein PilE
MTKYLFVSFVLFFCLHTASSQRKVELPWENDRIVYTSSIPIKKSKINNTSARLVEWIATQEGFYQKTANGKSNEVVVAGIIRVPTHNKSNPIAFQITCTIEKKVVHYRIDQFRIQEIDMMLADFFLLHKDTDNSKVQKTMHYLTVGVHSRISQLTNNLRQFLKKSDP